jgi:quinol-cytochrome oxidoreductase complex cytochrome b subunit
VTGRVTATIVRWVAQFWADLKASTDAGLLSVLRFLGLIYGPIDARLPIDQAFRKALSYRLAPQVGWRHGFGGVAYLLFIVLVVTGVLLSVHYRPSAEEAYPSMQHIVSNVRFGWLVRDVHVWSASLLVIIVLVHMARVFFDAVYKPPRETNWLVGVLLLFVVLAFGSTGYLLPWDQWAYWTVTQGLHVVASIPVLGGLAVGMLRGDPVVTGATLSRFFALHVIVLPWIAFVLLVFHFTMVRRHGVAPLPRPAGMPSAGRRFFPDHLLRSFMVAVVTAALVITAAVLWPRPVGDPADPARFPESIRSTWIVVDVSRALTHYLGVWGFLGFTLLALSLVFVPLFDRGGERSLRRRPVVATIGILFFALFVAAWMVGRGLHSTRAAVPLEQPGSPAADTIRDTGTSR